MSYSTLHESAIELSDDEIQLGADTFTPFNIGEVSISRENQGGGAAAAGMVWTIANGIALVGLILTTPIVVLGVFTLVADPGAAVMDLFWLFAGATGFVVCVSTKIGYEQWRRTAPHRVAFIDRDGQHHSYVLPNKDAAERLRDIAEN